MSSWGFNFSNLIQIFQPIININYNFYQNPSRQVNNPIPTTIQVKKSNKKTITLKDGSRELTFFGRKQLGCYGIHSAGDSVNEGEYKANGEINGVKCVVVRKNIKTKEYINGQTSSNEIEINRKIGEFGNRCKGLD